MNDNGVILLVSEYLKLFIKDNKDLTREEFISKIKKDWILSNFDYTFLSNVIYTIKERDNEIK